MQPSKTTVVISKWLASNDFENFYVCFVTIFGYMGACSTNNNPYIRTIRTK